MNAKEQKSVLEWILSAVSWGKNSLKGRAGEKRNAKWQSRKGDEILKDAFPLEKFLFPYLLKQYLKKFYPIYSRKSLIAQ